ncbi:MAG: hypothetical protein AB7D27_17540 [Desulfomicrobium sp.]
MPAFDDELEASGELLKNAMISKDQARAYVRSLAWFRENRAGLEAAGWNVAELYRIGTLAFPYSEWGPGWLTLWNNEKCRPRLGGRGDIEFVLHEAGGDVVQTCRREKSYLS